MNRITLMISTCISLTFLNFSCSHPIVNPATHDLAELASVGQYLKVYSAYQDSIFPIADRVPENPLTYSTPSDLFLAIADTLRGNYYTNYRSPSYRSGSFASVQIYPVKNGSTVSCDSLTDSTAYIQIAEFIDGTAQEFVDFLTVIKKFPNLVIDVQRNPGGDLNELDNIIACILPMGKEYIIYSQRMYDDVARTAKSVKNETQQVTIDPYEIPVDFRLYHKKIAVVMDSLSASASEILAAALKDADSAMICGDTSYGKGIGQVIIPRVFGRDTLEITFLRIQGLTTRTGDYHRKGLVPDEPLDPTKIIGATISDRRERNIFYAVRELEPGITRDQISMPSIYLVAPAKQQSGAYKQLAPDSTLEVGAY